MSVRPGRVQHVAPEVSLWSTPTSSVELAEEDAKRFTAEYEADVQFIFSHVQHHWHKLVDKERTFAHLCSIAK